METSQHNEDICARGCKQNILLLVTLGSLPITSSSTRGTKQIFRSLLICRVFVNREHFGFWGQRRFASRGAADPAALRRRPTFYYGRAPPPSRVEECFDVTVNDTICVPGNVSVREVRIEAHKGQQDAEDV